MASSGPTRPAHSTDSPPRAEGARLPQFIFILVLLAALWFLMIRPRQRQLRAQQRQIAALEVGDEIVTAGGLYGMVRRIDDGEVRVEIAPDLEVRIAKRAIAGVLTEKHEALAPGEGTEEEGR